MSKDEQVDKVFAHGEAIAAGRAGTKPVTDWKREWRMLAAFTDGIGYKDERFALINAKMADAEGAYKNNDVVTFHNIRDQCANIYWDGPAGKELVQAMRAGRRYAKLLEEGLKDEGVEGG